MRIFFKFFAVLCLSIFTLSIAYHYSLAFRVFVISGVNGIMDCLIADRRSPESKAGHRILGKVEGMLSKRYNLAVIAIREGGGDRGYDMMGFSFVLEDVLDKDRGRAILIDCADELIKAVNEDPDIQQYLIDKLFTLVGTHISSNPLSIKILFA